ncbi:spermidine synthase [Demequina aurantiaca]|uniref:spermidine synthase n=1 Tax=Demequina aurantiaca TaxID=676200 RepID=UPI003D339A6C
MARHAPVSIAPNTPRGTPIKIGSGTVELRDESDGSTTVWVNNVPSSSMRPEMDVLDFEYMRHMAAAVDAWNPVGRWLALHVGAAACSLPRYLAHAYPESGHIAVDIDTTLPELVREWWDLPRAPRLRIRTQDGLAALETRRDDSLDLVVRDAFAGDATPPHLADAEWWRQARRAVRPSGLVVANVGTRPGTILGRDDTRAARAHFSHVVAVAEHAVLKGKRRGNVVLVAGDSIDTGALGRYAASAPLPTGVDAGWNR